MSTLLSTPSLSYNELCTLRFDSQRLETSVSIITSIQHPPQPEPEGCSFVIPSFSGPGPTRQFLSSILYFEREYGAGTRRETGLALRNGDRIFLRLPQYNGEPRLDLLLFRTDYNGFTTMDVATASHALEEPRFSAADLGLPHPIPLDRPRSPIKVDGHKEYIVDRILDYKVDESTSSRSFLVRWLGYEPLSDSYITEKEANNSSRWTGGRESSLSPLSPRSPTLCDRTRQFHRPPEVMD
ncbi:hypothetical protein NMY22_g17142 [Coprinellus aureogranulatus]|nr:hypothetical protein NMY22_g17142 [Coprinellus aureogranulatus]